MPSITFEDLPSLLVFPVVPEGLQNCENFDFMGSHMKMEELVKSRFGARFSPTEERASQKWNRYFKEQNKWIDEELPKYRQMFRSRADEENVDCTEYVTSWREVGNHMHLLFEIRNLQEQLKNNRKRLIDSASNHQEHKAAFRHAYRTVYYVVVNYDHLWFAVWLMDPEFDEAIKDRYKTKVEELVLNLGADMFHWKEVLPKQIQDPSFGTDKGAAKIRDVLSYELDSKYAANFRVVGKPFANIVGWARIMQRASLVLKSIRNEVEHDEGLSKKYKFSDKGELL